MKDLRDARVWRSRGLEAVLSQGFCPVDHEHDGPSDVLLFVTELWAGELVTVGILPFATPIREDK